MSTASNTAASKPVAWRDKAVTMATELGAHALHSTESWVLKHSLVPTTPYLPPGTFTWVDRVERMAPAVQAELDEVLSHREDLPNFQDISIDQQSISNDDGWKTFFFLGYGFRS
jgi:aspartyl/asparaginyl beta-hydroxylase (cupin superfamily)